VCPSGPPIALLARALRRHPGEPGLEIARLTVEILGPIPVAACEIAVRVLRPGRRIELLQGELRVAGRLHRTRPGAAVGAPAHPAGGC
jgi:hypothetical protein